MLQNVFYSAVAIVFASQTILANQNLIASGKRSFDHNLHNKKLLSDFSTKSDSVNGAIKIKINPIRLQAPMCGSCGLGNVIFLIDGDSLRRPMIGGLDSHISDFTYRIHDTLIGNRITGVVFPGNTEFYDYQTVNTLYDNESYIVATDSGFTSFELPREFSHFGQSNHISGVSYLPYPGIERLPKFSKTYECNKFAALVRNSSGGLNVVPLGFPDLTEFPSYSFLYEPDLFIIQNNQLFISATDSNGNYQLHHFENIADSNKIIYELDPLASNARELIDSEYGLYLLSTPGDTIVTFTSINKNLQTSTTTVIFTETGARATGNCAPMQHPHFAMQTTSPEENQQISMLNIWDGSTSVYTIDESVDYFLYREGITCEGGILYLNWISIKNSSDSSMLIIGNDTKKKINIPGKVITANPTYGCWVSINENTASLAKAYPNPVLDELIIECEAHSHEIALINSLGSVVYSRKSNQENLIHIPVNNLSAGIYYLKISQKNKVQSQKIVIE